jgi:1-acyl-sn-glycerol-3-phosphate acyltransferase
MSAGFYRLATFVTKYLLLPPYTRISVEGLEHLPLEGGIVIATNHLNDADPGILATRLPRRLVFLAKAELFRIPILRNFMEAYGAIPVRRNEADLVALRRANEALKEGLAVCMFPEGTRSGASARLLRAWPGAALIALRADVPIVPVAITGAQYLPLPMMFLRPLRRYRVHLKIGLPFRLPKPERINAEAAQAGTDIIMQQIAALLPPSYRGYYGNEAEQENAALPDPRGE